LVVPADLQLSCLVCWTYAHDIPSNNCLGQD
jgi:hypothetical protein